MYYLPKFQFPSGKTLLVDPPACSNNTTIKIPYEGTADYTVTVKEASDFGYGSNPSFSNFPTETINGVTYRRIPVDLVPGSYTLVIENKAGVGSPCPFETNFTVLDIPAFQITNLQYLDQIKDNSGKSVQIKKRGDTGRVSFNISGSKNQTVDICAGSEKFSKTLSSSSVTDEVTYYNGTVTINLKAGEYNNIRVENAAGCQATYLGSVKLAEPDAITFNASTTSPSCNAQSNLVSGNTSNGKITLSNIQEGIGNYTYKVNNGSAVNISAGSNGAIIDNQSAGTYSITISDEYGNATTINNIVVTAPNSIVIQSLVPTNTSMWCLTDGSIKVNASGGTGQLTYSKENNNLQFTTENTLTGYSAGQGKVYIKDNCDCIIQDSALVSSPSALSVTSKTETPPVCHGGNDGKCVLQLVNRQGTLSVSVYPTVEQDSIVINGNTVTVKGLSPGNYVCTFTQTLAAGKSCSLDTPFYIPEKSIILLDTNVTPVSNKGSATGKITANVSGGNGAPFTLRLHDSSDIQLQEQTSPSSTFTFTGLTGESANGGKLYMLTVTDSKGCLQTAEARIPEPADTLRLHATVTTPVSCHDSSDAIVTLSAEGGWSEYQYSKDSVVWNTQTTFTGYPAGTYKFYVRDKYSGTATATVTVTEPQPLDISTQSVTDAACFGTTTGTIRFRVSGGTLPYTLTPTLGTVGAVTENDITYLTVSGLPAGDYTFTLKDSHNCTLQAAQATIDQPTKLTVSTSNIVQPTCGWANGSLTATASGGVTPYIYTLKAAGTDIAIQTKTSGSPIQFENIAGGNYYITITDKNGCTEQSAQVIFNQYTSPAVKSVVVNDVICFGESNGKITATAQAGTVSIAYFTLTKTSDNTTTQNTNGIFENLTAGDYTLFMFDTNGCQSQNAYPVAVKQPGELRVEVNTIVPVINKDCKDGKIRFRVAGGNIGNTVVYLKDDENTKVDSVSAVKGFAYELHVKAGAYTLEAVDSKSCLFTTGILQVNEPADSLHLVIREVKDALCKSQTGRITVEGQGGWGSYRYQRAGGQYTSLNRFENLYPGTYYITVTDKMGATAGQSITVYEPQDSLKAAITNLQIPTCGRNGVLSINLSGGTAPYKLFSDAGNDTVFAALPQTVSWVNVSSGALMLHLTDANGCRFNLETVVPDTALLHIAGFELLPPNVPQAPTGSIKANIIGGVPPFTYSWRKIGESAVFPNNPQITHLSSGYYELKITDNSGCSVTKSIYLPDSGDEMITVVETGDETAINAANGYAILYSGLNLTNIRVINPENNYTDYPATTNTNDFHLSNDTIYLSNLASGKWVVIGTDTAAQKAMAGFEIIPYKAFIFGKIEIVHVSEPNGTDGSVSIEILGGAGDNIFVWTDEKGNALASRDDEYSTKLSNLPPGKYMLTVTDRFGNVISTEVEVLAPEEALRLNISDRKNQSCSGMEDAYVILSAVGGWGDYRYAHYRQPANDPMEYHNAETYSSLKTGDHYFYVVDKYGITAQLKITVTEPDMLRARVATIENVKCKGEANGQITFEISGGNAPYYFKESASTVWQKGNIATLLPAGEYTFEFTDSLQCSSPDVLTVTVTEPDSLLFQNMEVTHTTCGEDNGLISVSLKGGTRPYSYRWIDPENNVIETDSVVSGLKQNALYRLYVTDKNGCTQYVEQLTQASKPPVIVNVATTDVLCYSDSTGTARVTAVEAGEPYAPYSFAWSTGKTGDFAGKLPAGQYFVTVSDTNNCATTYYFNITQPDSLYLLITDYREPHCFGYSDGAIETQTFGGTGGYTYLWSTGTTTPNVENIPTGDYWVRVTDENGCVFEKQFTLNEPAYQHIDLGEDVLMCPGNKHVVDGGDYVSYRWFTEKNDNLFDKRYFTATEEGHYYLEAKTPDGCSAWGDISVGIGDSALKADMLLASQAAVGDTLVIFELSNLPLDSLKWEYDTAVFERLTVEDEYYNLPYVLQLRCLQTGIYNIGLAAYSGGCYSPAVKQVEIVEAGDEDDDEWGAKEPMIQSLKQYPNPSNGIFTVELELRETAEARFVIFEVASGICIEQRIETNSGYYREEYNLSYLQSGVYILIVTAGNERRQIKIIIE